MLGGLCFIHATRQLPLGRQGPSRVRVEGQRWVPADCCRVQSIPSMKEANRKEIRCPCCNKLIGKVRVLVERALEEGIIDRVREEVLHQFYGQMLLGLV